MQNLKIRVNSADESKEIQNILESKGFKKLEGWSELGSIGGFIWTDTDMAYCDNKIEYFDESPRKEITLPQLRAMASQDQDEPFLTPECTMNDQYAEIEQVRQAIKVKSGSDSDHALDAMSFGLMGFCAASGGAKDNVNHPSHYAGSAIECIDAMEAMMTPEQFIGYLRGNLFKYQWRYEKKNGIEDLKKAQWYLEKLTVKVAEKNAPF